MDVKRWIGLDPSVRGFGYAVLQRDHPGHFAPIDVGTWRTAIDPKEMKTADIARRVRELMLQLDALLSEHDPIEAVYIEGLILPRFTSKKTVSVLGRVRGMAETLCWIRGLEVGEVAPATLKQIVAGRKDASKEDVARVVVRYYADYFKFNAQLDDNATDALAVAHVGAFRHGSGVTVSSGVVSFRNAEDDGDFFYD